MNEITVIIVVPALAAALLFMVPERHKTIKGIIALLTSAAGGIMVFAICGSPAKTVGIDEILQGTGISASGLLTADSGRYLMFTCDPLSKLIVAFVTLFSVLILLYSLKYIRSEKVRDYYSWFLITLSCSYGAALADNLILFLGFWGILGITLYKLVQGFDESSSAAAKKTLILIGASDSIMIFGIAVIWLLTGSLSMGDVSIPTDNPLAVIAFLALLTGAFTKAGAFPFHTWVPDYASGAPASSSAWLPASLDKLLGIYFLARLTTGMFILNEWLTLLLVSVGVITIITAVMMALIQHDYKRLLGFHAVSQVGYMILGFGLGSVIGIAAGLFHMINNTLYKSGLFLAAGSIEYRTGKSDIDELGGLSGAMPLTFISSLIFAVSISGIPPFNGFASKWMIYQGIIDFGSGTGIANNLWVVWLGLAVLGSALTLASFIKFIGGIFLGRKRSEFEKIREAPLTMWIPVVILASVCVFFGVFATNIIVPYLLVPVTGSFSFTGLWNSSLVSLMVLISIVAGVLVYVILSLKKFRTEDSFIGGERMHDEAIYPVTGFYNTIREFRLLSWIYGKAEDKWFDVYDLSKRSVLWVSHQFSAAHTGVLTAYVLWALAGLIVMLIIMT
jgi:formate hydrogenlyase subunit 3/multisubunit Na+/H+ antiporter MnhD subunit